MVWLGWAGGSGDVGRVCDICRLENWSDGGTERSNYGGGGGRVVADTGTQTSRTCWHPDHWVNTMLLWTCVAILWSYVLCYTDEMRVILLLMLRMYVILLPHDRLMYETMKLCLAVCIWWVTRLLLSPDQAHTHWQMNTEGCHLAATFLFNISAFTFWLEMVLYFLCC